MKKSFFKRPGPAADLLAEDDHHRGVQLQSVYLTGELT
jgi:hypothetical protein